MLFYSDRSDATVAAFRQTKHTDNPWSSGMDHAAGHIWNTNKNINTSRTPGVHDQNLFGSARHQRMFGSVGVEAAT